MRPSTPKSSTANAIEVKADELDSFSKMDQAAQSNTSKAALVEKYGEDRLTEHPDGTWEIKLNGWKEVDEFDEMDAPRQRLECENADRRNAVTGMVTLRNSEGFEASIPESIADSVALDAEMAGLQIHRVARRRVRTVCSLPSSAVSVDLSCGHRRWIYEPVSDAECPYGCGIRKVL